MIPFRFESAARNEVETAIAHYRSLNEQLAVQLWLELSETIDFCCEFPLAGTAIGDGFRKRHLRRFPYVVIYSVESDVLVIYAFPHKRQRPWKPEPSKPE